MSNVFVSFIKQIQRPTQSSLYGGSKGDALMNQSILSMFQNGISTYGTQSSIQQTGAFTAGNFCSENNHLSLQINPLKLAIQTKKQSWVKREHFMMKQNFEEYLSEDGETLEEGEDTNRSIDRSNFQKMLQEQTESIQKLIGDDDLKHLKEIGRRSQNNEAALPAMMKFKLTIDTPEFVPTISYSARNKDFSGQNMIEAAFPFIPSTPNNGHCLELLDSENEDDDLLIKKPRKTFDSKQEHCRYIESFRTKYKTEMCKNWTLTGRCLFQDSCSFAHGPHELNCKADIPRNYKTKPCKRYHRDLYCPYGIRCQFKHGEIQTQQLAEKAKMAKIEQEEKQIEDVKAAIKEKLGADQTSNRKRLQIFEKITLTKTSKKKSKKLFQ